MLDGIGPSGANNQITGPSRKQAARVEAKFTVPPTSAPDAGFPASPPPEMLAQLDKAARVIEELSAKQVNLHFEVAGSDVKVQVRDGNGKLVRQVPQGNLLDALAGNTAALYH